MRSACFETRETLLRAFSFAEADKFEPAGEIAHATLSAADVRAQA